MHGIELGFWFHSGEKKTVITRKGEKKRQWRKQMSWPKKRFSSFCTHKIPAWNRIWIQNCIIKSTFIEWMAIHDSKIASFFYKESHFMAVIEEIECMVDIPEIDFKSGSNRGLLWLAPNRPNEMEIVGHEWFPCRSVCTNENIHRNNEWFIPFASLIKIQRQRIYLNSNNYTRKSIFVIIQTIVSDHLCDKEHQININVIFIENPITYYTVASYRQTNKVSSRSLSSSLLFFPTSTLLN